MKHKPNHCTFLTAIAAPAVLVFSASQVHAVSDYTNTTQDSWATAGNWTNGIPTGAFNQRVNIRGGTTVTFAEAQGTVTLGATGGDGRPLVLANTAGTATLNMTGGVIQANTTANGASLVGVNSNGSTGILNVSGGTLDLTTSNNALGRNIHIGLATSGAVINGTINVSGTGLVKVNEIRFGENNNIPGGGGSITGVINLNGGTLEAAAIREGATATSTIANVSSTINFNGGLLKLTSNAGINSTIENVNVLGGGARIEVGTGIDATSGKALLDGGGGGGLDKTGAGSLALTGTNTYTGATTVSAGTLFVTGALSNSAVTVEAAGTIASNGLAGTLGNGLPIDAGGNLNLTGATLGSTSTGILGLTGGTLTLGTLTFQDLVGWDWFNADVGTYELIEGSFSIDWGSTAYLSEETAYDFGNGKKGYFTSGSLNAVIIPEPSAALLCGLGMLALLRRRR